MIKLGAQPEWTKSTYTIQNACVEIRSTQPATVEITDSKFRWDRPGAPLMTVSPSAFAAMVAHVRI